MKKIACLLLVTCIIMPQLASCGHEHSWGEWDVLENADCNDTGRKVRVCKKCGEDEFATIDTVDDNHWWLDATCKSPKSCGYCGKEEGDLGSHNYSTGRCKCCGEWMELSVNIPESPLVIDAGYGQMIQFTKFNYRWSFNSNTSFDLYIKYDAEKIFDDNGNDKSMSCWYRYKVIDSEGYTINSGKYFTTDMCVGDKIKDQVYCVARGLDPNGSYTIIISEYE